MLAEQQNILDCPGFTRCHQALLQLPRFRVTNQSDLDDGAAFHCAFFTVSKLTELTQTLICNPRTEANASPMPSHTVGCACIIFIISSIVPSRCSTAAASARISVASGPIM